MIWSSYKYIHMTILYMIFDTLIKKKKTVVPKYDNSWGPIKLLVTFTNRIYSYITLIVINIYHF